MPKGIIGVENMEHHNEDEDLDLYIVTYIDLNEETELENNYTVKAWVGEAQTCGYAKDEIWKISDNHKVLDVRYF